LRASPRAGAPCGKHYFNGWSAPFFRWPPPDGAFRTGPGPPGTLLKTSWAVYCGERFSLRQWRKKRRRAPGWGLILPSRPVRPPLPDGWWVGYGQRDLPAAGHHSRGAAPLPPNGRNHISEQARAGLLRFEESPPPLLLVSFRLLGLCVFDGFAVPPRFFAQVPLTP